MSKSTIVLHYIYNVISITKTIFIMSKSKLAKCHKLTLSAGTKCPAGHYLLAVSVQADTIC